MIESSILDTFKVVPYDSKPIYYIDELKNGKITHFITYDDTKNFGVIPTDKILGKPLSRLFVDLSPDYDCEFSSLDKLSLIDFSTKNYILKDQSNEICGIIPKLIQYDSSNAMVKILKEHYAKKNQSISHELLNIINGIVGVTEILNCNHYNDSLCCDEVSLLSMIGHRLKEFVDVYFRNSDTDDNKLTYARVDSIIEQSIFIMRHEALLKNITITSSVNIKPNIELPSVYLFQVLINLIKNSIRYTNKGGKIVVKSYVEKNNDNKSLIISVIDDGIGISKDDIDKIFTSRYRGQNHNDKEGKGIGLHMVQKIVESINGSIDVCSPPSNPISDQNDGSQFTITIPI